MLYFIGYRADPDSEWEGNTQGPGYRKVWLAGKSSLETSYQESRLVWNTALWRSLKGQGLGGGTIGTVVEETEQLELLATDLVFKFYLLFNILDFCKDFNVNEKF